MWELPITIGCTEHRCRLEFPGDRIRPARTPHGEQPQPVSVPEPLATLENYTHQALAAGLVELPGRTVHAGVWFRLLRSLLDELSLAVTTTNRTTRRTLELIWDTAGLPLRAGICVWRPYEQLPWTVQEQLLTAAAVAVQLVTERTIIARGTLGPVLVEPAPQRVYAGDGPRRRPVTGPDLAAAFEAWIRSARTRPERARQILWNLAAVRPTDPEHLHRVRRYLIDKGIPPEFLHQDEPPGSSSTSPRDDRRPARAGNDDHRT